MQVFPIVPASLKSTLLFLLVILIPVLIVAIVFGASLIGMRAAQFEVSASGLRLLGDLYGRTIPAADIRGASARLINLNAEREFQPTRRILGTGLPGYRAGWFRLQNGEKALLFVTDPTNVVYVPTRANFAVLLSPQDPKGFLNAIRATAPGS